MMSLFSKLFTRPTYPDDEKNLQARLIHAILLICFVINILYLLWEIIIDFPTPDYYFSNILLIFFLSALFILLKHGYVRFVSGIFVTMLWLVVTNSTYYWGGVLDPLYPAYLLVIVIAGWALSPAYSVILVSLSSGVGYLYLLENGFTDDGVWAWETATAMFVMGAMIAYLSQRILKDNLKRLKNHEQALERSNKELAREVNERKQIEKELKRTEAQYRQMIEMSPVAMLLSDRHDFTVRYANVRALRLFRASSTDKLIGKSIHDRLLPKSQQKIVDQLDLTSEAQTIPSIEYRISRSDDKIRDIEMGSIPIEFEGSPMTLSVIHDITHRKQFEMILRENEARYRNLLDSLPIALTVVHFKSKKIAYVNPKAIELLGARDASQLLDMPFTMFVVDNYQKLSDERFKILEEINDLPPMEYAYRRLDGREIIVEIMSIRTEYEGNDVVLSAFNDVTERRQIQSQLQKAEHLQLAFAEKNKVLAMKDTFMTTISHEFRTPLTVINSSKELLEKYFDRMDEERKQRHFDKMGHEINYMIKLLDDILFLSEASSGMLEFTPQRVDLPLLCSDVFNEYQDKYNETHQLILTIEGFNGNKVFALNEGLFRQTLKHLYDNAIKYSPNGGRIELLLRATETGATIKISDEGIGIPDALKETLFEPFKRGNHNLDVSSLGLGLAIIKQVVNIHEGTISCDSVVDEGTTFTINIPIQRKNNA